MTNTSLLNSMIDRYNRASYTHNYIFGFSYRGNIYMKLDTAEALPAVLCLDRASRGCGYAIRFCPTTDQKIAMLTNARVLCSEKFFNETCSESIYNRGEIFEKLVTESFGQIWEKDNVPFTDDGDITVNGVAYQIKFQKATFCNEKSIANLTR